MMNFICKTQVRALLYKEPVEYFGPSVIAECVLYQK